MSASRETRGRIVLHRDIDSCDVIAAIEAGLELEAQLKATHARRTSGWLFNQPQPWPGVTPLSDVLRFKGMLP